LTVVRREAGEPQAAAGAIQARAREILMPQCPEVRNKVRSGHPATEIVREAGEGRYDLVIVGERPASNLGARFLFGSTTIRVVEHAPCPVIVAKGEIGPLRRFLLCDSGRVDPSVGLAQSVLATREAEASVLQRFVELPVNLLEDCEEIVILHVMSQIGAGPGVEGKPLRGAAEDLLEEGTPEGELLRRNLDALDRMGIAARAKVRHGLVVEEILHEVQSGAYDLVAIGAYRGKGWQRILLDDLAHRLIVELRRPVLVLR
jgi:nucleotide-binding universal stress UspA family protein